MAALPITRFPGYGYTFEYPPPDEAAMRKGEVQDKKQDKKQKEASGSLRPKGLRRMFRKASSSMLDIDTSVQKDFAGVSPASSTSGGSDGARDRAEIMRRRQGYLGAYPRKNSAGSSVSFEWPDETIIRSVTPDLFRSATPDSSASSGRLEPLRLIVPTEPARPRVALTVGISPGPPPPPPPRAHSLPTTDAQPKPSPRPRPLLPLVVPPRNSSLPSVLAHHSRAGSTASSSTLVSVASDDRDAWPTRSFADLQQISRTPSSSRPSSPTTDRPRRPPHIDTADLEKKKPLAAAAAVPSFWRAANSPGLPHTPGSATSTSTSTPILSVVPPTPTVPPASASSAASASSFTYPRPLPPKPTSPEPRSARAPLPAGPHPRSRTPSPAPAARPTTTGPLYSLPNKSLPLLGSGSGSERETPLRSPAPFDNFHDIAVPIVLDVSPATLARPRSRSRSPSPAPTSRRRSPSPAPTSRSPSPAPSSIAPARLYTHLNRSASPLADSPDSLLSDATSPGSSLLSNSPVLTLGGAIWGRAEPAVGQGQGQEKERGKTERGREDDDVQISVLDTESGQWVQLDVREAIPMLRALKRGNGLW